MITTTVKPLTPGQFWQTWRFISDAPCLDEQVELNVPRNRSLKMKSPPDVSPASHVEGDRQIYVWKTTTEQGADTPLPGFAKTKGIRSDYPVAGRGDSAFPQGHVQYIRKLDAGGRLVFAAGT